MRKKLILNSLIIFSFCALSFAFFLLFVFGALVSVYHVGIEEGIFSESLLCELGISNNAQDTEQLLKSLQNTPISCKEVTFTILGLSLATFNAVLSIVISCILFKLIFKNE